MYCHWAWYNFSNHSSASLVYECLSDWNRNVFFPFENVYAIRRLMFLPKLLLLLPTPRHCFKPQSYALVVVLWQFYKHKPRYIIVSSFNSFSCSCVSHKCFLSFLGNCHHLASLGNALKKIEEISVWNFYSFKPGWACHPMVTPNHGETVDSVHVPSLQHPSLFAALSWQVQSEQVFNVASSQTLPQLPVSARLLFFCGLSKP